MLCTSKRQRQTDERENSKRKTGWQWSLSFSWHKQLSVQALDAFLPHLDQWKKPKLISLTTALIIKYYSNSETQKYLLASSASLNVKWPWWLCETWKEWNTACNSGRWLPHGPWIMAHGKCSVRNAERSCSGNMFFATTTNMHTQKYAYSCSKLLNPSFMENHVFRVSQWGWLSEEPRTWRQSGLSSGGGGTALPLAPNKLV